MSNLHLEGPSSSTNYAVWWENATHLKKHVQNKMNGSSPSQKKHTSWKTKTFWMCLFVVFFLKKKHLKIHGVNSLPLPRRWIRPCQSRTMWNWSPWTCGAPVCHGGTPHSEVGTLGSWCVPWSRLSRFLGDGKPPTFNDGILIMGPYKPLRDWVDEFIPYYMEIMGV